MKKISLGINLFGYIEILTFLAIIFTLVHIDYYSMAMLFFPIPVIVLGILTIKLKPSARRLNILLSPLIVFTYISALLMIFETMINIFNLGLIIHKWLFNCLFIIALIIHIYFFTRPSVKEKFQKITTKQPDTLPPNR